MHEYAAMSQVSSFMIIEYIYGHIMIDYTEKIFIQDKCNVGIQMMKLIYLYIAFIILCLYCLGLYSIL